MNVQINTYILPVNRVIFSIVYESIVFVVFLFKVGYCKENVCLANPTKRGSYDITKCGTSSNHIDYLKWNDPNNSQSSKCSYPALPTARSRIYKKKYC